MGVRAVASRNAQMRLAVVPVATVQHIPHVMAVPGEVVNGPQVMVDPLEITDGDATEGVPGP
jgi:hypothetical protein